MAVYKVPQDVEADDKLIGPFSFRQFVYLIIVAISMAGSWGLSQLFIPLAIIPLPIIVFFAALALPLRKDQPMEAYLSAVVSFYFLKSRKRFWQPDGIDSFVTIIPPKDADKILTKDLNQDEATKRLEYLAGLVDTHGWAIRGAGAVADTSISNDLYYESQQTPDMMDSSTPAAQAMTKHLSEEAGARRKNAISSIQTASKPSSAPQSAGSTASAPAADQAKVAPATKADPADDTTPPVSKLPTLDEIYAKQAESVKQQAKKNSMDAVALANALLEEAGEKTTAPSPPPPTAPAAKTPTNTSVSTPDTGTIELTQKQANELSQQTDVSVQTLAKEANRVAEKNKVLKNGDEVTISFH